MCGIAGIVAYRDTAAPVSSTELLAMRDSMAKRGPDGSGLWISGDGRVGLAHRRLAIIDLSEAGVQPMSTADGRLHITFNGEIYNYREIRQRLVTRGYVFRSQSDTEVLLHLYADRGAAMVQELRGMFTFAIWDERDKTMFIARDPFGIKPLYYADDGATLRFASQVKALIAGGAVSTSPCPAGHIGFFVLGSVPEPFTIYRDIHPLAAGEALTIQSGRSPTTKRFFDIAEEMARVDGSATEMSRAQQSDLILHQLRDTVRHHMIADVPVGLFLSSGLDSSIVAALAREVDGGELRSLTLGFEEYRGSANDETPMAARTAGHLRTLHETRWITRSAFESELENLMAAMDQPSIDGVNTYFVSKAAASSGMKVALSGLGGDELFGGYPSFTDVPRLARLFRFSRATPWMGVALRTLTAPLLKPFVSPKFASLFEYGGSFPGAYLLRRGLYMPWELAKFMDPALLKAGWDELRLTERFSSTITGVSSDRQRVSALELSWYMKNQLLRDADWAGMAHSLEIRVPLVDVKLFRATAPLLASRSPPTKIDAAASLRNSLPRELLGRRKTGFSIPVHEWMKHTPGVRGPQRQLRSWAHAVYRPYKKLRALVFLSDAFGGHGGIALYNRDFLTSLSMMDEIGEVVALPRLIMKDPGVLPPKLRFVIQAANSKFTYVTTTLRMLSSDARYDMIFCCHMNLVQLSVIAKLRIRAPLTMFIYGIDAWLPQPLHKKLFLRHVDRFVSISDITRRKFTEWANVPDQSFTILPNAIHREWYGPGNRDGRLVQRYGLEGKIVLMTLGRLVSSERYKGFDEVLEVIPSLTQEMPNLVYLIVGDGSDRRRLEEKVGALGISEHVRFTGMIPEEEKADHYRLADVYVMPSRGEGFGFVFLEAMACGIPAVASRLDGGREAVRDGLLGILVNPADLEDVKRGILAALRKGRASPPQELAYFDFDNFRSRSHLLVKQVVSRDHNPMSGGNRARPDLRKNSV